MSERWQKINLGPEIIAVNVSSFYFIYVYRLFGGGDRWELENLSKHSAFLLKKHRINLNSHSQFSTDLRCCMSVTINLADDWIGFEFLWEQIRVILGHISVLNKILIFFLFEGLCSLADLITIF